MSFSAEVKKEALGAKITKELFFLLVLPLAGVFRARVIREKCVSARKAAILQKLLQAL